MRGWEIGGKQVEKPTHGQSLSTPPLFHPQQLESSAPVPWPTLRKDNPEYFSKTWRKPFQDNTYGGNYQTYFLRKVVFIGSLCPTPTPCQNIAGLFNLGATLSLGWLPVAPFEPAYF